MDGNKFEETVFEKEDELESIIKKNSKTLFGNKTVYFDIKNKIEAKSLGGSIPDGILIDFKDRDNPEFYLVEIELASHDFFRHIFPQITRFFAFFKNTSSRENLMDKLHRLIDSNSTLKNEIEQLSGKKEIYKLLKDIIDNNQNILLIIDDTKAVFNEITRTYIDTWGKMVKIAVFKQYTAKGKTIFTLNPDFENIELVGSISEESEEEIYDEHFHMEGISNEMSDIYKNIKTEIMKIDDKIVFNPQKYYISIKESRNFAYIELKKKKVKIVIMVPHEQGKKIIKTHKLGQLTEGIQKFYGKPCFQVIIENNKNLDEIISAIKEAYDLQK